MSSAGSKRSTRWERAREEGSSFIRLKTAKRLIWQTFSTRFWACPPPAQREESVRERLSKYIAEAFRVLAGREHSEVSRRVLMERTLQCPAILLLPGVRLLPRRPRLNLLQQRLPLLQRLCRRAPARRHPSSQGRSRRSSSASWPILLRTRSLFTAPRRSFRTLG